MTDLDKKVLSFQNRGALVPPRHLVLNDEQIAGIRRSGEVNTGVLDLVENKIRAGMTTAEIDKLVYDYTTDIINVDVSTIKDGFFSDASRMFIIGRTTPEKERLVRVTKECLEIGAAAVKPWGFVGDIGKAIEKHAKRNGYSVVRELCGHGVGLEFHEDPEVEHYNTHKNGMLLVPGMVFTIEPMINMGKRDVFIDEADGWTVVTEDELPSAQWEHTFLLTENGMEILTY